MDSLVLSCFAGREWLVTAQTPGANIQFDLLLIWLALLALTIWSN